MIDNYRGNKFREYGYKRTSDGNELPFRFEYITQDDAVEGFLSNLQMVGNTVSIRTATDLNWSVKDVVLLGKEDKDRYQVTNISKMKKAITKNFYVSRVKYDYILTLSA